MMMTRRLGLVCALFVLAGVSVRTQSSAAISAARGAAVPAGAAAVQAGVGLSVAPRPLAQSSTPASAAQPSGTAASDSTEPPPAPAGFTYNPEGRRDPFVSLAGRGADTGADGGSRPAGLAGLATEELTLRGTLRSRDGFVAMLQGADQKTYIVRPGDKLFDATVSSISQNDLVILQQVNDPLSLETQREVRKGLRQVEAN
jgi:Tfp pilus assembly protein PilP